MSYSGEVMLLLGELGETDCEEIGDGYLGQPVNSISSGAYTLFGLWLVWRALRHGGDQKPVAIFYGLALASVGIGSIAFHGPVPPGARLLHDLTIAAVLAVIAAHNLALLRGWGNRGIFGTAAGLILVVGAVMAVAPDVGNLFTGLVGIGAAVTEIMVYRSGRRRFSRRVAWILGGTIVLLAMAGIINLLGRTDGPLCDPDSYFQGHALWHALTAAAFMLYGYVAFSPASD
jgi:hypothetical protein